MKSPKCGGWLSHGSFAFLCFVFWRLKNDLPNYLSLQVSCLLIQLRLSSLLIFPVGIIPNFYEAAHTPSTSSLMAVGEQLNGSFFVPGPWGHGCRLLCCTHGLEFQPVRKGCRPGMSQAPTWGPPGGQSCELTGVWFFTDRVGTRARCPPCGAAGGQVTAFYHVEIEKWFVEAYFTNLDY